MRSIHNVLKTLLNLDLWPTVDERQLTGKRAATYAKRREAMVVLVRTGNGNLAAHAGGISVSEVWRVFARCTKTHNDGRLTGFRGCVSYYRIKAYELQNVSGACTAGLLSRLFDNFPKEIERPLIAFALGKSRDLQDPPLPTLSDLRDKLLSLCETAGIGIDEYPRNTENGAIRSLSEWRKNLANTHGRQFNQAHFGALSARNFDDGKEAAELLTDPNRIFVFDEYTTDLFTVIGIRKNGATEWAPMRRFKTVNGKRRGARDVVVSRRFLCAEPCTEQFLQAVETSIRPHQRHTFTIPGYCYPSGPCHASEIPGGAWLLPDIICLDWSKVHLAEETRLSLTQGLGCILYYGVPGRPKCRSDIEAWHAILASEFRKAKCTTGTGTDDPRGENAEDRAKELRVEERHVAELLELARAKFFHQRLKSLKGRMPLEEFQRWTCGDRLILRHLPISERESFHLAQVRVEVSIWCDQKSGGQPVVRYMHAEYIGPKLAKMRTRHKERCILCLNRDLAHVARLYSIGDTPVELDVLHTRGEWREPHSLGDREEYAALRRSEKIPAATKQNSPMRLLTEYLTSRTPHDKDAALKLAEIEDRQNTHAGYSSGEDEQNPSQSCDALPADDDGEIPRPTLKCLGDW